MAARRPREDISTSIEITIVKVVDGTHRLTFSPDRRTGAGRGRDGATLPTRPVPARLDRSGDGGRSAARTPGPGGGRGAGSARGRDHLGPDCGGAAGDDVSAVGQGPLRRTGAHHRRPAPIGHLPVPELAGGTGADVHPGVDVVARSTGLPDRTDHRWVGSLHRHGADLERSGLRRHGCGGGAGCTQLRVPDRGLLAAGVVLSVGPSRLAGSRTASPGRLPLADRSGGADLPRYTSPGRVPHSDAGRGASRERVV